MSETPSTNDGKTSTALSDSEIRATETAAAHEELRKRDGRMVTVEPRFEHMQDEIKTAISRLVPGLEWSTTRERSTAPCSEPYSNTPGGTVTLVPFSSDTTIPADQWAAVTEAVNTIAVANGFDGVDLSRVDADLRQIGLSDPDGGRILLGAGGRTALMITTGCYLKN